MSIFLLYIFYYKMWAPKLETFSLFYAECYVIKINIYKRHSFNYSDHIHCSLQFIYFATCDFASSCIWIWISCINISILKHGGTLNCLIYQSRYSTSVCGCLWDWKLTNLQQRRRKTPGDTFTVFTLTNDITVQRDNACFLRWDE